MKKQTINKGFTLIELLVVIAIIGILSAIVLASLNSARGRARIAAAKSELSSMRAEAEIMYDINNGDYSGVCSTSTGNADAYGLYLAAVESVNATDGSSARCNESSSGSEWAAGVKIDDTSWFCVDSTGHADEGAELLSGVTVCS